MTKPFLIFLAIASVLLLILMFSPLGNFQIKLDVNQKYSIQQERSWLASYGVNRDKSLVMYYTNPRIFINMKQSVPLQEAQTKLTELRTFLINAEKQKNQVNQKMEWNEVSGTLLAGKANDGVYEEDIQTLLNQAPNINQFMITIKKESGKIYSQIPFINIIMGTPSKMKNDPDILSISIDPYPIIVPIIPQILSNIFYRNPYGEVELPKPLKN